MDFHVLDPIGSLVSSRIFIGGSFDCIKGENILLKLVTAENNQVFFAKEVYKVPVIL
jgi:hypothetical protein